MIKYLLFIFFIFLNHNATSQKVVVFDFENTLTDTSGKYPGFHNLVRPGIFIFDTLPGLENRIKRVYEFNVNSGISFNNHQAGNFIKGDYTIELYFKLDMYNSWKRLIDFKNKKEESGPYIYFRKISFYKDQTEDIPHLIPGQYLHYVISRNSVTREINIYLNGIRYITFTDHRNEGVLDEDNRLNFFHDGQSMGNESSAGAIALCKIYNYVLEGQEVRKNYNNLGRTMDLLGKRKPAKTGEQIIVKGNIFDEKSGAPVPATVRFELASDSTHMITVDNQKYTGDYSVKLPEGRYYNVIVTAAGFVDFSDLLDLSGEHNKKEVILDIPIQRLQAGRAVTLNKISFQQSKFELLPSSYPELDKLVNLMKEHPKMEIQLNGHTDNQGNAKLNVELSENRVKEVKAYLVKQGIDHHRIKGKGYGGSKPIASNSTETTRRLNRRVEMIILKY